MIGIIMATELEAHPFIAVCHDKSSEYTFPVYRSETCACIISGIGKANAAMAVALGAMRFGITTFVNLGAAGALRDRFAIGDIHHIAQVFDADRPGVIDRAPRFLKPAVFDGVPGLVLATRDRATVKEEERSEFAHLADLADMEGAGFVQACSRFGCTAYLFKIVTDVSGHDDSDIIGNVVATRDALFDYYTSEIITRIS